MYLCCILVSQGFSKHTFLTAEQVIEMLRRRVEQQNRLRDTFELFDIDRSGSIDRRELQEGLQAAMGVSLTDKEASRLFGCFDEDGSGEVEYKEVFQWRQIHTFVCAIVRQIHSTGTDHAFTPCNVVLPTRAVLFIAPLNTKVSVPRVHDNNVLHFVSGHPRRELIVAGHPCFSAA